ncbi:MAG: O-antigen ligase family protein [Thermoleophilia bacterium]|nr:O-antigen ligase family protein [Thermoleophilia bacterium]
MVAIAVAVTATVLALNYGGYATDHTAAAAVLVWIVTIVGLGTAILPRSGIGYPGLIAAGLLLGLTAFTAASIAWADDAGLAYARTVQMLAVSGTFMVILLFSRPGEGKGWLWGLTAGLGAVILLAAFSRFVPVIGDDDQLTRQLGSIIGGRLSWPLGYWNATGTVAVMLVMTLLWHAGHDPRRRIRGLTNAVIPVIAVALYLSASRGALIALTCGIALIIAFGPHRRRLGTAVVIGILGSVPAVLLASQLSAVAHADTGSEATVQGLILLTVTVASCAAVYLARDPVERWVFRQNPTRRQAVIALVAITAVVLGLVAASDPVERISSFSSIPFTGVDTTDNKTFATGHLLSQSGNGRWQLWESAINAFASQPLGGIGAGGYEAWFKTDGSFWMKTIEVHSLPLQSLAELGLAGFLLLTGFAGFSLYRCWRRLGDPALNAPRDGGEPSRRTELVAFLAVLVVGGISVSVDWTGDFPLIFGALLICCAAMVGPLYGPRGDDGTGGATPAEAGSPGGPAWAAGKKSGPDNQKQGSSVRLFVIAAVIVFGGVAVLVATRQYQSSRALEQSRSAFADEDGTEALRKAGQAASATPFSGAPYAQMALVEEMIGNLGRALASATLATEKSPTNDAYWLLRARIEAKLGLTSSYGASIARSRELNPHAAYWKEFELKVADGLEGGG